jgi:hypothetical protein
MGGSAGQPASRSYRREPAASHALLRARWPLNCGPDTRETGCGRSKQNQPADLNRGAQKKREPRHVVSGVRYGVSMCLCALRLHAVCYI